MANIFIVSSSSSSDLAFASLGTALQYVRDAHADENPEGSALMLATPSGLVPESTGAVRDRSACGLWCQFRAVADSSDADKVRSQLAGAVKACALIGVDPSSVAKVTDLREALAAGLLPAHPWSSVQINAGTRHDWHADSNNVGPSYLLAVGSFAVTSRASCTESHENAPFPRRPSSSACSAF